MADWQHAPGSQRSYWNYLDTDYQSPFGGGSQVSAGAGVKGAWTPIMATTPLPFECCGFLLYYAGGSNGQNVTIDFGYRLGGQDVLIFPDLYFTTRGSAGGSLAHAYIPMRMPKGSVLVVRARSDSGAPTLVLMPQFFAATANGHPGYTKATALGITGSQGTSVGAGNPGGWVELSASSPGAKSILLATGPQQFIFGSSGAMQVGVGPSGEEEVIAGPFFLPANEAQGYSIGPQGVWYGAYPVGFGPGSRVCVRQINGGITMRAALYAME